jgi:hypothetical protein
VDHTLLVLSSWNCDDVSIFLRPSSISTASAIN